MRNDGEPYDVLPRFANDHGVLWPYAVAYDQIESGWVDSRYVGALALQLARSYKPRDHGLAAFIVLSCKWPSADTTSALNLLGLAHRVAASSHPWLDRLVGHAALQCLKAGLCDPRSIVSEGAANVFGGLGDHHFSTARPDDIDTLRTCADQVLEAIDQREIATLLSERIRHVLDGVGSRSPSAIADVGASSMIREIESCWPVIAPSKHDLAPLAALKSHVTALAWRFETRGPGAVQTIYVYSDHAGAAVEDGWAIVAPWSATVRSMLGRAQLRRHAELGKRKAKPAKVQFRTMDAMSGSLSITMRVETDEGLQADLTTTLRSGEGVIDDGEAVGDLDDLRDLLRNNNLHVRIAHVEADGNSASIAISPTEEPAKMIYSSRKLKTGEVPQANEPDRIFALVDCIAKNQAVTAESLGVVERQVQYYKAAARILELVTPAPVQLTRTGWLLHVATGDDKYRRFRATFESTPCGQTWIEWAKGTKLSDVPLGSAVEFLTERSELSGDTISRRASTLDGWLKLLRSY